MDVKAHIQQVLSKALGRPVQLSGEIISPEGQPSIDDMPEDIQRAVAAQIIDAALPKLKAGTDYQGEGSGILVGTIGKDAAVIENVDAKSIDFAFDFMRAKMLVKQIGDAPDDVEVTDEQMSEITRLAVTLLPVLVNTTEKAARDKREMDMLRPVAKLCAKTLIACVDTVSGNAPVVEKMRTLQDILHSVPVKSLKMMLDKYEQIDQNDHRG